MGHVRDDNDRCNGRDGVVIPNAAVLVTASQVFPQATIDLVGQTALEWATILDAVEQTTTPIDGGSYEWEAWPDGGQRLIVKLWTTR